jgi:lysophospholipase L1-like esterase
MFSRLQFALCLIPLVTSTLLANDEPTSLPKVVLVGDSIRMSYAPIVAQQLANQATIVSATANGGDSNNVLKHLDEWVIREKPAIVHFNCGIHDTKKFTSTGKFQISPDQYEANLREIVKRIRDETEAVILFATSTPILDERAAATRQGRDYNLLGASIEQYNAIAIRVMKELGVPIDDLHSLLAEPLLPNKTEDLIGSDGVHLTDAGKDLVGTTVAEFVRLQMADSAGS